MGLLAEQELPAARILLEDPEVGFAPRSSCS